MSFKGEALSPRWLLPFVAGAVLCCTPCIAFFPPVVAVAAAISAFLVAKEVAFGFSLPAVWGDIDGVAASAESIRTPEPVIGGALTGACLGALIAILWFMF